MILAGVGLFACLLWQAQVVSQNVSTGQQPMAIAVNEITHKTYVVNHNSDSVTVLDGKSRSVIATIKTGRAPEGLGINPVTNLIYVANSTDSSVAVIDG